MPSFTVRSDLHALIHREKRLVSHSLQRVRARSDLHSLIHCEELLACPHSR